MVAIYGIEIKSRFQRWIVMKSNVDYMKKIVKEMKSKVNLSIVSTDYAKGYCYALLDYLIDNDDVYDDFARTIDDVFN